MCACVWGGVGGWGGQIMYTCVTVNYHLWRGDSEAGTLADSAHLQAPALGTCIRDELHEQTILFPLQQNTPGNAQLVVLFAVIIKHNIGDTF